MISKDIYVKNKMERNRKFYFNKHYYFHILFNLLLDLKMSKTFIEKSSNDDGNESIRKENRPYRSWSSSTSNENYQYSWCQLDETLKNFQKTMENVQKVKKQIHRNFDLQ